ncbi:hypothetical protein AKG11_05000 [Shinella sp. SUS2]|uniref:hypothetical protein n=1 Tax=unclassified Shinella TaxID=2643062 RepID=UPI000682ECFC|nr:MULTISPECIES: hypothetical protein [unclassified Shinella]KNY18473.1 hypothetical protein AKG11_05000 [Shinella sp. SUS2]KOC77669.1 hypothetical protein AKG10_02475 [Shinella sp. GWS1]
MPQIATDVLKVLDAAIVEGSKVILTGQLDRKLYSETDKVLQAAGGKWNRSAKAHVFDGDAAEVLEPIILTGEYSRTKQDFGQFDTPGFLAADIAMRADIFPGAIVLEPNAGLGNLAFAAEGFGAVVHGYEIDPRRGDIAKGRCAFEGGFLIVDFLAVDPEPIFDRVVMNPPFAKQDDIRHVLHAFKFLKPGGRLVSIMSASTMFRANKLADDFRRFVGEHGGTIELLPDASFKSAGTSVSSCVVALNTSGKD